ncbi:MAG: circadian clock protein KaiB, partial [Okeania sp. SIO4D6]|nr:circadian clock protein KaiB [Okeania sp. SIO4D6]
HFLIPGYTATIDKWLDHSTQEVQVSAEAYAPVLRYQILLNAIFKTDDLIWQPAPWSEEFCNPMVIASYYDQFSQLWENHDLVVHLEQQEVNLDSTPEKFLTSSLDLQLEKPKVQGSVLRLFVSGNNIGTERTLKSLHQILEKSLSHPYTLKVIDVLQNPEQAEADQITATPTLIRVWPLPVRRIVGEFNDVEKIIKLLEGVNSRF